MYYLCYTKSYFTSLQQHTAQRGTDGFRIEGEFEREGQKETISYKWQQGRKELTADQVPYTRAADHIGKYAAVMIAPDDMELINDGESDIIPAHLWPSRLNFSNPADRTLGAGALALTILGNTINWDLEISALQQEGRGEVISNPRIVTSNQREAVIRQGQEVGYLTVTGGQSNNVPTVQFKEVLLELKVTPTITNDGRVFLAMEITKDEISGFTDMGAFGSVPNLNKREITTAVLIDDGQTVSIGGVYEFRDRSEMSKVPFLADLPIIGNLFKRRGRDREKAELLIFVTPKVLRVAQR